MMSGIRSKDTLPEVLVRKALYAAGFRYKKNKSVANVTPDIVLSKQKVVIFVHGCFWHHHENCKLGYTPKSKKEFWTKKFKDNLIRDRKCELRLQLDGWRVAVFWECATRNSRRFYIEIINLIQWIESDGTTFETQIHNP